MLSMRLTVIRLPQFIVLSEASLDRPLGICSMDFGLRAPAITSVLAHHFSRHFFDSGLERLELQARPLQLSSLQTAHEWTRDPRIGDGHLLVTELFGKESTCISGLLFTNSGEVCVDPVASSITVELAPVVIPSFRAVESFSDVVVAFTVAREVEEFVSCSGRCGGDQLLQVRFEELPLGLGAIV